MAIVEFARAAFIDVYTFVVFVVGVTIIASGTGDSPFFVATKFVFWATPVVLQARVGNACIAVVGDETFIALAFIAAHHIGTG